MCQRTRDRVAQEYRGFAELRARGRQLGFVRSAVCSMLHRKYHMTATKQQTLMFAGYYRKDYLCMKCGRAWFTTHYGDW